MNLLVDQGTLLAAWPDLLDPNFMHAVLLMCHHNEEGAYGLVVNRPTEITVGMLLQEHPLLGDSEFPVHLGGPVDHGTMQFLHTVPDKIPGGLMLTDEIALGGDLDALGVYLRSEPERAPTRVRVLLGYSGWGAGQLENELSVGSWVPAAVDRDVVFGADPEETWRRVVASIGGDGEDLKRQPPDPTWN